MAGTSSSSAWVVIGLLLVPLVALGADAVQRGLETESFPTAPLHANERFVYDVTVLSDFTATRTTAHELIEVVVGEEDEDGPQGVFPIRTTRGPAPWDTTRPVWEDAKQRTDVRLDVVAEEFVDRDDGRVSMGKEASDERQWYTHDGDVYRYALQTQAKGVFAGPGVAAEVARHAATTWTHEVPVLGILAPVADAPHDLPLSGTFDGRIVYGRHDTTALHHGAGAAPFGCDIPALAFDYSEPETAARHAHMAMQVLTTRTEWRAPELALPVVVECHRAYVSEDDKDRGHIRVIATLVSHDAGGAPHHIDWEDEPVALPRGDHTAVPTVAPGVPADTANGPATNEPLGDDQIGLRFPLNRAHQVAREGLTLYAPDFASQGDMPYALVAATYWPGTASTPACTGMPDDVVEQCGRLPVPLQRPEEAFVKPHWYLTYENAEAERIIVQALRNMTTTGQVIEEFATVLGGRHHSPVGPVMAHVPDELVPVHDMLAHWLDAEGIDQEVWREQVAARLEYRLEPTADPTDGGLQPIYVFREGDTIRSPETNTHPLAPNEAHGGVYLHEVTQTCTYLASDGALIDKRDTEFLVGDAPVATAESRPAVFALPEETSYRPVASVVVGVVGLGSVALGATSGGRTWLRGLLALPLFTKVNKEDVLEHRTRKVMVGYVKANPGIGTEEIRRHLDIGWGTAVYHLAALERNGLLSSMRRGGNRHWFAAGLGREHDREAIALLRSAAASRLHDAIRHAPGRTQQELAAELGITHGAVIFQVRKLERVGLIRKQRDGRFVRYFVTAADASVPDANAS